MPDGRSRKFRFYLFGRVYVKPSCCGLDFSGRHTINLCKYFPFCLLIHFLWRSSSVARTLTKDLCDNVTAAIDVGVNSYAARIGTGPRSTHRAAYLGS